MTPSDGSGSREGSPDLIYVMPHAGAPGEERAIRDSFARNGLDRYFRELQFFYLSLSSEKDHYIREVGEAPPNGFGYKSGPNYVFFGLIDRIADRYSAIMLLETDCIPIRSGWLDRLQEAERRHGERWVLGSRYHGPPLGRPWTYHLNGNAIYRVGDPGFRRFVSGFWKPRLESVVRYQRPELAFDCVWEEYRSYANGTEERKQVTEMVKRCADRFLEASFVVNMAPNFNFPRRSISLDTLTSKYPEACLVHGSWLLPEVRRRLGIADPGQNTAGPARTSRRVPGASDQRKRRWIWIKGFGISRSAWFDDGRFLMGKRRDMISWRIGYFCLPTVELQLEGETRCRVEIRSVKKNPSKRISHALRRFDDSTFPGKALLLAPISRLRDFRVTVLTRIKSAILARDPQFAMPLLTRHVEARELGAGVHRIDLRSLTVEEGHDVQIILRNSGGTCVSGKILFHVTPGSGES